MGILGAEFVKKPTANEDRAPSAPPHTAGGTGPLGGCSRQSTVATFTLVTTKEVSPTESVSLADVAPPVADPALIGVPTFLAGSGKPAQLRPR